MQLVDARPSRPIPIRITPLIDVVFILLVFFMLTSRLLPVNYLELGNNTANTSQVSGEPIPEFIIAADGRVHWQEHRVALDELAPWLQQRGLTEINLGTEPDTPLGDFTRAFSQLNSAGITAHWKRSSSSPGRP